MAKNGSKFAFLAQNEKLRIGISLFLAESLASGVKNITALVFRENLKNGPFLANIHPNLPKFGHLDGWDNFFSKLEKIHILSFQATHFFHEKK